MQYDATIRPAPRPSARGVSLDAHRTRRAPAAGRTSAPRINTRDTFSCSQAGGVMVNWPKTQTRQDCRVCAGRIEERRRSEADGLADEGEVVIAAGGIGDCGATVGRDAELGRVGDSAAINAYVAPAGVANADGVAGIAAAVDIADGGNAAVGRCACNAAVTSRRDIGVLHDGVPLDPLPVHGR